MGAHSTFEQALKGVTAFATAVTSESDSGEKSRSKNQKKTKSKKEKKEKRVLGRKEPKRKGDDKRKKHKKRKRSLSSDDKSSGEELESLEVQLERGRAAARCTRELMSHFPGAKQSLRQMFWRLDNNEAVNVAGIPDANLRGLLEVLFGYLNLLKAQEGVYVRRKTSEAVLRQIGYILDETPAAPSAFPQQKQPENGSSSPVEMKAASNGVSMSKGEHSDPKEGLDDSPDQDDSPDSLPEGPAAIGPQFPTDFKGEVEQNMQDLDGAGCDQPDEIAGRKRVVGPAVPPQELLDQAAEVAEAMAAEEAAIEDETMIGPPPPELVAETEAVAGDTRTSEVLRILKILDAAARSEKRPDAYEVVDVAPDSGAAEIKKRYWKLSLLIHPDKCAHPKAQDAFNAVSQAAKDLQDAGQRGEIDKGREKAEFEAFAEAEIRKQETARQWRVARGEATEEDLRGPIRSGPASREEWITVLPAAKRPTAPSQKNQTAFSQQGVAAVGQDATSWSDTPADKLLRLQAAGTAMLSSAEAGQEKAAKTAQVVDKYNQAHRSRTLIDKHMEKQQKERKKKHRKDKSKDEPEQEEWMGNHPWRPFDREKDLQASTRPTNPSEFAKKMGELSSRFGGSSTAARKFL